MDKVHLVILTFNSGRKELRKITADIKLDQSEVLRTIDNLPELTSVYFLPDASQVLNS